MNHPSHTPPARPGVAALIPARNCGPYIGEVVEGLIQRVPKVWVVDDGSTDDTAAVAARAGATVVKTTAPPGKGRALRRGLQAVLGPESEEWVLFLDGDGQHLPAEADRFLGAMGDDSDLLLGSRLEDSERFPGYRLITNRIGSAILGWMTGASVPDTQCGYRAARSSLLRRISLESEGYEIETEILMKALRSGARWKSIPVSAVYNGQVSHFNPVGDTYRICMAALRYAGG